MVSASQVDFIFIDDEDINNLISRMTVEITIGKTHQAHTFTNPQHALAFLKDFKAPATSGATVMLLDINMPVMSGWEFLEYFDNLPAAIKAAIRVYILSSSVDQRDRERSYANKNVIDFLIKPLTKDVVERIVKQANT